MEEILDMKKLIVLSRDEVAMNWSQLVRRVRSIRRDENPLG